MREGECSKGGVNEGREWKRVEEEAGESGRVEEKGREGGERERRVGMEEKRKEVRVMRAGRLKGLEVGRRVKVGRMKKTRRKRTGGGKESECEGE